MPGNKRKLKFYLLAFPVSMIGLSGCAAQEGFIRTPSMLAPGGVIAGRIAGLSWFLIILGSLIFIGVMAYIGSDPGNSVTNKYGQVWDTPNVFVTGAALYPQYPGANPSETLCTLAYLTGDALVDRFFKDSNQILI